MGDMADMCMWDERDLDDDGEPNPPAFKTCRCCGEKGLEWGQHQGKWRLHKLTKLHVCPANPLKEPAAPRLITDPTEKAFRAGYDAGYAAAMEEANPGIGPGYMETSIEEEWDEYRRR